MSYTENNKTKEPLTKPLLAVLSSFLKGNVITIDSEAYRFAQAGDILVTETTPTGEVDWVAQETGIFKRFYSFDAGVKECTEKNATGCRWVIAAIEIGGVISLIKSMTQEELTIALSNFALTDLDLY